jgi:hypothetical protein
MGDTDAAGPVVDDFSGRCLGRGPGIRESADDPLSLPSLNCMIRKVFKRIPTQVEWARFRTYARRIRELIVNPSKNPLLPDALSVLQHSTLNAPLLPGLKAFECWETTAAFVSFIPLFLSPKTEIVNIKFAPNPPTLMLASTIATLSTLCPDLREISLRPLPRDLAIVTSVSEMLLARDRNTLRRFDVDSPLTGAACEVLYRLPNLSKLWSVFEGPPPMSSVVLPNLTRAYIVFLHSHEWLQRFSGALLNKLVSVAFYIGSLEAQTAGFLEELERVALSTSISTTLLSFTFHSPSPWNPTYSSLLTFKQLTNLTITNPCHISCSSTVDDDLVINLSRAMPRLNVLRLGSEPCQTPSGVTIKGLVELACHCTSLSTLRVHIRANSLVQTAADGIFTLSSVDEPAAPRKECALTTLEVGNIPIPEGSALPVALALLHIFPRLSDIKHTGAQWGGVVNTIKLSKGLPNRIDALARSSTQDA